MPEITTSDALLLELARELEEILFAPPPALNFQPERNYKRLVRYKDIDWDATTNGVPYGLTQYRVVSVGVVPHMREEEHTAADDDGPGGAKARGVSDALDALYPDDIIKVTALERDNTVRQWLIDNGRSVPVDLGKAVRRELAKRSEEKSHAAGPRR